MHVAPTGVTTGEGCDCSWLKGDETSHPDVHGVSLFLRMLLFLIGPACQWRFWATLHRSLRWAIARACGRFFTAGRSYSSPPDRASFLTIPSTILFNPVRPIGLTDILLKKPCPIMPTAHLAFTPGTAALWWGRVA